MFLGNSLNEEITSRPRTPLWFHADWIAICIVAALLVVGVAFIYGAGLEIGGDFASKWYRQLAWIGLGAIVYVVVATVDYHFWARKSPLFYAGGLLMLVAVLLFGHEINHTKGWMKIPGVGFLQPVELVKPLTLLLLSWVGTRPALRQSHLGEWLPPIALFGVIIPPLLLICLQPDLGTAMVFLPVTIALIFLTGLRLRWFGLAAILILTVTPYTFNHLETYQQDRVKVFAEVPATDLINLASPLLSQSTEEHARAALAQFLAPSEGKSKRDDWNAVQSLLAVGSGGFVGKGYLKGTQHVLGYLPRNVSSTDFIFSVIAEETGFLGSAMLLLLQALLLLCFCRTALMARDRLGSFLAIGVAVIFATHIIINIAMTIRMGPIIGLPLPFVSYGGSFMLGTMFLAGLAQSVELHRRRRHLSFATENAESTEEDEEEENS